MAKKKIEMSKRFNKGKVSFFDLPMVALAEVAKNGMYGRSKYSAYNWKKASTASETFDCLMRHILRFWQGEDDDPESAVKHLACIAWNAMAAIEKELSGRLIDDRYVYEEQPFDFEEIFSLNEEQKEIINEKDAERKKAERKSKRKKRK